MVRAFLAIRLREFFYPNVFLVVFVVYANFNTRAKNFSQIWWKLLSFPSSFKFLAQKTFLRLKNALIESNTTFESNTFAIFLANFRFFEFIMHYSSFIY